MIWKIQPGVTITHNEEENNKKKKQQHNNNSEVGIHCLLILPGLMIAISVISFIIVY